MLPLTETKTILTGARDSPLSMAQLNEVQEMVRPLILIPKLMKTTGDLDKKRSLRELEKSDFFTKELDELLLRKEIRMAIHSAKDLPDPLREGLKVFWITRGVDPRDALVLRDRETLKSGMLIGTSSLRREEIVSSFIPGLKFCDIRGTIEERLSLLFSYQMDGLVVAEAALIRLKLTHLNRLYLPGMTAKNQGKLAIVGRSEDDELESLLTPFYIYDRKNTLSWT